MTANQTSNDVSVLFGMGDVTFHAEQRFTARIGNALGGIVRNAQTFSVLYDTVALPLPY